MKKALLTRWLQLTVMVTITLLVTIISKAQHKENYTTIVYDIAVKKKRHSGGIEETYNGGTKAVFISQNKARIRLVSLMRIQSIYFDYNAKALQKITVVKESGEKKYYFRLSPEQWKQYNNRYDSIVCDTSSTDSLIIAGYPCRKAVIIYDDDKKITAYYTDSIKSVPPFIDPVFRCIPGTVLQYEFSSKKINITYTAASVSNTPVEAAVFSLKTKGFKSRKFVYKPGKKVKEEETEDDTEAPAE